MNSSDFFTSSCRHCRHYCPEGRRGGHCDQLNVSVQGAWKACPLAAPVFAPAWNFQSISMWQSEESTTITPVAQTVEVTASSL